MADPAARTRIIAFGDLIDDVVVVPAQAIRDDTDTPATIRALPGGSPANTAAWLGALGASVDFVGIVGAGDAERHAAGLPHVRAHLREHASLSTGAIVVLVTGETRSMLTDRGANAELDPDDVSDHLLDGAGALHLTGHALLNSRGFGDLVSRARRAGAAVSIAPGSAGFIVDYGIDRFLAQIDGASVLFPSLEEGRVLTGAHEPADVVRALERRAERVVLTLGAAGVFVDGRVVPATRATVIDPTGAGDAFCAGYLDAWMRGGDPVSAAIAGTRVAARAVTVIGGRPPR